MTEPLNPALVGHATPNTPTSPFIYNDVVKQQPEPSITNLFKEPPKEEVIEKLQHQIRDMYKNNDKLQSDLNTALAMVRMLMNRNYYY